MIDPNMPQTTTPPPIVSRQSQPTFLFIGKEGPDAPRLRIEHLHGHLRHVEDNWDHYVTAGPLKAPGSPVIRGSALIIRADILEAAWDMRLGPLRRAIPISPLAYFRLWKSMT
jgi:uncharacterized protein